MKKHQKREKNVKRKMSVRQQNQRKTESLTMYLLSIFCIAVLRIRQQWVIKGFVRELW